MPENVQHNRVVDLNIPKSALGRADLLMALAMARDEQREVALAAMLGFVPIPGSGSGGIINVALPTISASGTSGTVQEPSLTKPVFRPYYLVSIDNEATNEEWDAKLPDSGELGMLTDADQKVWGDPGDPLPEVFPIVPWTRLWPRQRRVVAHMRAAALDVPRLTEQMSRGLTVRRLPRKMRLNWPSPLPVVLDFSDRLTPYWDDWHWFRQQLQARFNQQVRFYRLHGVPQRDLQPLINGRPEPRFVDWPKLNAGDTLLLVSDLGMIDPAHSWPMTCWQNKLTAYRKRGVRVIVLAPVAVRHLQPSLVNVAEVIRLSPDSDLRPVRRMVPICVSQTEVKHKLSPAGEILLAMMSIATRVEPALLRALRNCLPEHNRDAGLEGEVWCYPRLDTAATACALTQWAVQDWREKFADLPDELQQRALDCLRDWHAGLPQAIHHEETLLWRHLANRQITEKEEGNAERARQFFYKLKNTLKDSGLTGVKPGMRALQTQFADRHVQWLAPSLGKVEPYIAQLFAAVAQAEPKPFGSKPPELPSGVDPVDWLKAMPAIAMKQQDLLQRPDLSLIMGDSAQVSHAGYTRLATINLDRVSLLWALGQSGEMSAYQSWIWVDRNLQKTPILPALLEINAEQQPTTHLYLYTGRQRLNFETFSPPSWATAWGQDAYGFYAELNVQNIVQRFRWVTPGNFLMGSPDSEPERMDNETQHEVTLTQGYWLADSASTQALWIAVMGDNPSYFKDDLNNPVEQVSWDDVQLFIERLNDRYEDLHARLPTEAEWEYACRAGTVTPFSFGENITPEQVNYNGNYSYANGEEGLYREKTVPVKTLPVNPWGLYEMHGNVWEWCADGYGEYKAEAVTDPAGLEGNGIARVLRGGSWSYFGGGVRSADRDGYNPADRSDFIGFRLALGRAGGSRQARQ